MPPKKSWTHKSNSETFRLVHRSQQDSLYYDDDVANTVLVPVSKISRGKSSSNRTIARDDMSEVAQTLTPNEGAAAVYGIAYDDSEYDYLQHLKPMGVSNGGVFVSADKDSKQTKKKNEKLAALLEDSDLFESENKQKYDYQKQQDIPDEIKGFKPNLNEDLREALTALEDENYLDADQDIDEVDFLGDLLGSGSKQKELSLNEYDQLNGGNDDGYYKDDENWDLDEYEEGNGIAMDNDFNWEKDFGKFKQRQDNRGNDWDSDDDFSDEEEEEEEEGGDFVGDLPTLDNLKSSKSAKKNSKRRKGTKTDTSSYSMSSSAMARTEQMTIIDDKFDVLKDKYDQEEEQEEYQPFDLANERDDFMDLVDDFLDNYQMENRNRRIVKKNSEEEKYRQAALDVTKTKIKLQKEKPKVRGIIKELSDLNLEK